jgi:hypothetical protein
MRNIEQCYRDLADAIVVQAANDYRKALGGKSYHVNPKKDSEWVKKEVEKFFHSSWFRALTHVDGDFLIEQLQREHNEKIRKEKLCKLK